MGALSDLRVLDLTQVLAGPYCTMLLADMGADVVKVERPGGDLIRPNPPFAGDGDSGAGDRDDGDDSHGDDSYADGSDGDDSHCDDGYGDDGEDEEPYGGYFQSVNRGKRSVELDLGADADRAAFLSLVEAADVVVENYRAGTMEKFDLGYERLRERNPELVYASIRGFGDPRTGATHRQGQPSFDLVAQALGGVMEITGREDGPPTKVGPGVGDLFTAALSAVGVLAAVHHRERTGEGQYVDTAMYDAMVSLCERAVYQYSYTGEAPTRQGNSHPTLFPYDAFETADGYVVVAAFSDGHWRALCEAMDRPDLAADYPDAESRVAHRGSLRAAIADWTGDRATDDVVDALEGAVPAAPVQDVADVFADPHVHARDMLVAVDQPGADRQVTIAGSPIKMSETDPRPRGRAPLLDEHREALLGDDARTREGRSTAESDD